MSESDSQSMSFLGDEGGDIQQEYGLLDDDGAIDFNDWHDAVQENEDILNQYESDFVEQVHNIDPCLDVNRVSTVTFSPYITEIPPAPWEIEPWDQSVGNHSFVEEEEIFIEDFFDADPG